MRLVFYDIVLLNQILNVDVHDRGGLIKVSVANQRLLSGSAENLLL